MQERVADLQKYVEVLKTEKDDLQANDSSAQHSLSTGSNVRRVGNTQLTELTHSLLNEQCQIRYYLIFVSVKNHWML